MMSYGYQEMAQAMSAYNKIKGGDLTEMKEGLAEMSAIMVSGIGYGVAIGAEYSLTMMAYARMAGDEEEYDKRKKELKANFSADEMGLHALSHFVFMGTSKYSQMARVMLLLGMGTLKSFSAFGKERQKEIDEITRKISFGDPITFNKYEAAPEFLETIPPLALGIKFLGDFVDASESLSNAIQDYELYNKYDSKYRQEADFLRFSSTMLKLMSLFTTKAQLPLLKDIDKATKELDKKFDWTASPSLHPRAHGWFWEASRKQEGSPAYTGGKVRKGKRKQFKRKKLR